ncbi:MAG: bifunctional UDP-N-acetylglucosamine diphosphorylase/glucosamine-1-phosphate N-acetyltransferase GlmU [Clostridiales bacterium]|nr:bifunctional UDP-N-acetylglucosamine diphosphorylase/glucosamine-1-phosphate N-acetyltransferase GlmU [Clostridiales bacterium]
MDNVVILAGGQGKRMKADIPKPMFKVLGEPMLEWVIKACKGADLTELCIVKGYKFEYIDEYLKGSFETVLQEERLGTGHAVMQAIPFLKKNINDNTLVLCGDAPFIDSETIKNALKLHKREDNSVTVITSIVDDPTGYGRVVRSENGIASIVEEKDATEEQKKITEINSGAYWFKTADLVSALDEIKPNNAQGEYYLTDSVFIALNKGKRANAYISENPNVVLGANDRKGLLLLNNIARMAIIEKHMENGIEFNCTDGITIGRDVKIGLGTEILQGTIIKGNTVIGENCVIGPNCLIENCEIGDNVTLNYVQAYESKIEEGAKIGPFVHIRPNSVIGKNVKIGDFVEVKNSNIGENTSIAHLTYVGDSDVGSRVNFGCGCVTVNYDGVNKNRCKIGDNCFIGCNTNLIAPVKLGEGVYTAAGSTITKDVPDYALAIERGELKFREGYSKRKLKDKLK